MISDRAPALAERADAILDAYLDGKRTEHKLAKGLNRVIAALPPKECGCHLCTVRANASVFAIAPNEGEGHHESD